MRIAVNCRLLIPGKLEGIGWFIYETLKRMINDHPNDEFILLFDRKRDKKLFSQSNVKEVYLWPQARHPLLYRLWFDLLIPKALKKHQADIFLSADGFNSLNTTVPTYLIIHDLAYLHYPEFINPANLSFYEKFTPRYVAKSTGLGTVSEFSKRELIEHFNVNPDDIDVIPNGCRPGFKPVTAARKTEIRAEWGIKNPFFIYNGSLHPRKNAVNLIRAFNHFKFRGSLNYSLVIVGRKAWMVDLFESEVERSPFKKQIHLTGYLEDEQLADLMGAAEALVYPSLFEGFGVPLLEAMHAEIPIITSNVSSLPEVAGNAAILVDPRNPQEIGSAMYQLAKKPEIGQNLMKAGIQQRKRYNWDRSAKLLYSALLKTAKANKMKE